MTSLQKLTEEEVLLVEIRNNIKAQVLCGSHYDKLLRKFSFFLSKELASCPGGQGGGEGGAEGEGRGDRGEGGQKWPKVLRKTGYF